MMYKWGHPVATLPSDGRDYASLSLNDVNSANHSRHASMATWPAMPPNAEYVRNEFARAGDLTSSRRPGRPQ
eukprot:6028253-Pleurochrysis_carterae.AAC.2